MADGGTQEKRAQGKGTGLSHRRDKEKFFANTPEEVANRLNTGYGKQAPQNNAPAFKQIPGGSSGKSLADPSFDQRSGMMKFSAGPKV